MTSIDDIFYLFSKYEEGDLMASVVFQEPSFDRRDKYLVTRGEIEVVSPAVLDDVEPGPLTDKIHTGHPHLFVFSQRFFDVLRDAGITGWTTYSVDASAVNGADGKIYTGLVVTGRVAKIDKSLRRLETRPSIRPNQPPKKVLVGPHFDLSTWDGSDIFIADPMYVCVTRRFKDVVEKHFDFLEFESVMTFTLDA